MIEFVYVGPPCLVRVADPNKIERKCVSEGDAPTVLVGPLGVELDRFSAC